VTVHRCGHLYKSVDSRSHNRSFDLLYYTTFKLLTCKISNLLLLFVVNVHLRLLSPEAFFSPRCTNHLNFGGRAPPGPAVGAYSAGLRGLRGRGKKGEGKGKGEEGEGKVM